MKEVDKALADQKVSGRRMVIEEVEGSEDEEPVSTAGQVMSNGVASSDDHTTPDVVNNTDANQTHDVLPDKTKEQCNLRDSEDVCHNVGGGGDADTAGTEVGGQAQLVTAKGDSASADESMPPAVLTLKDAGNDLFRKGQYAEALEKYNAAIQLLGEYNSSVSFCQTACAELAGLPGLANRLYLIG